MTELFPCPFCGGEAEYIEWSSSECDITVDHKDGCWLLDWEGCLDVPLDEKDRMIEAWNARHRSTCEMKLVDQIVDCCIFDVYECSECGHTTIPDHNGLPRHCEHCGRKVVQ